MFELTFSLNVWNRLSSEVVNFNTLSTFNRTVKLVDFSIFCYVFLGLVYYNGQRLVQLILPCCPAHIVISILISCFKLFEQIKMVMMKMMCT